MCQEKGPVELVVGQATRVKIGSRSGPDIDAVDLDALDRPTFPPTLATSHQDRETGGSSVDALCRSVEVVGGTVDPAGSGHDGQAAYERELR